MKQALAILLLAFLNIVPLAAQSNQPAPHSTKPAATTNPDAVRLTEALTAKYTLTADQAKQMYQIQNRKLRSEKELATLKTTDPTRYHTKLENLQTGTLGSVLRILQTKEQVNLYRKTQADVRSQRAAKKKELLLQNTPKEAVEAALLEIYAE